MPLYYNIVIISEIYESDEGEFPHGQCGRETGLGKKKDTEMCKMLKAMW